MEEPHAGTQGLPNIDFDGNLQRMPSPRNPAIVVGDLLLDLGSANLQHALLARLVGTAIVLLRELKEGGCAEGTGTCSAGSEGVSRVSVTATATVAAGSP